MFGTPKFIEAAYICKPGLDVCTTNICDAGHDVCTITIVPQR